MLFNEPKLLKLTVVAGGAPDLHGFSALQRAEIAEICALWASDWMSMCFSALQRAEIAEMILPVFKQQSSHSVSVLFNEPKLLKSNVDDF